MRDSPAPSLPINEDLRTRIKEVMSKRYDVVTKMLDLSQFHLDPGNTERLLRLPT